MKEAANQKKHEASEDMETGDTARSGTLSGTPPEYETTATDFLSQLAPPGLQFFFSFIRSACTRSGLRTHKLSQASYTPLEPGSYYLGGALPIVCSGGFWTGT